MKYLLLAFALSLFIWVALLGVVLQIWRLISP
ncbi:hypothetical protein QO005_000878 [Rhizobium paknamense]|uniref:Uncharacterized protein n=1 Tax=Rhizobium paknamense TaxID=1206817 RepID=A0ABU0IB82_9HYPH|nr:hypothetical protein [Rhizobium paknamense]